MGIQEKIETLTDKAQRLIYNYTKERIGKNHNPERLIELYDIKVVWFCKTLKDWKAMVIDLSPGGMFFEVTYNGDKQESYIDAYKKFENVVVKDGE